MWDHLEMNYVYENILTKLIYDETNNIDYLSRYNVKSKGQIKKYAKHNIDNLLNENDREDNSNDRIWCIFVKHLDDYIPVFHWNEDALLHTNLSTIDVSKYDLRWNKKIDHIYRIIIRDEEEMEYNQQPATIINLLIFNDNSFELIELESLDIEFNPNQWNSRSKPTESKHVLFEISYKNYTKNPPEKFNVVGFGYNSMLCVCFDCNIENNIRVDLKNINSKSELFDSLDDVGEYDYDNWNELFVKMNE